jgi:hypothetical protein
VPLEQFVQSRGVATCRPLQQVNRCFRFVHHRAHTNANRLRRWSERRHFPDRILSPCSGHRRCHVLTGQNPESSMAEVARGLGVSHEAVGAAVSRLRKRYRELLRDEIRQTVAEPEEVDDELRSLFAGLVT